MAYQTINAFEAKTHLSKLLSQVIEGKGFLITKHNHPVALLLPYNMHPKQPILETISQLKKLRIPLHDITIKELKEEGRR